jgi:hypothetical protein
MDLASSAFNGIVGVALVGGLGGLFGGFAAGRRSNIIIGVLLGALGGIAVSTVARSFTAPTLITLGDFGLDWALGGGLFFAYVIGRSSR